ncbi:MAG: aldehyde ferredoxin oxidoreductase, partial [Candidatus Diapherotrites archaeon]|nr:aldehyde ferredoxin oxidoreductase [Candidatus Diapherotrites archaeon]
MKGVTGFFLHVDLTASKIKRKHIPESVFKDLLGGNGLAMYLLSKYGKPKLNALDAKSPLIFVTGPLTG